MRIRVFSVLILLVIGGMTFSLIWGQERTSPTTAKQQSTSRQTTALTVPTIAASSTLTRGPARDFSKLEDLPKEMLTSCQRGADWLSRVNSVKGRFSPGLVPALKTEIEGDHFLRQAGAAFALARAARFLGEDRYAARATQAILTLLDDTVVDAIDPQSRHTLLPSMVLNRLGAAGLLVLAINELPAPQADLLEKSEQLCNWIRRQARPDGSLRCDDGENDKKDTEDSDNVNEYPGLALYAVLKSHKQKPAAWKTELATKAVAYYRGWWKQYRSKNFVPWQTAAWAEAYVLTKQPAFAEFVFEMNDWLCTLQYDQIDPHRLVWYGGFMKWVDGKTVDAAPTIVSARYAGSLAEACRVARAASDATHHDHYTLALQRGLQFVVRLQYTDANAQHFEAWYRPRLVGGFHASFQDGDLRIDYTQHALAALVTYLEEANP